MASANQRIGEYVLVERIGGGTFGEVWRAHHHVWADQLVAVKLPTDSRYVRNLQKQGVAVHSIVHPNVVRAIGCDPYADAPYLTMEYVPGTSLRPLVAERKLTISEAVSVMEHVLRGLKCAHEKGVLHLDIKPENILIHERALRDGFGLEGIVKITDFGVGAAAATTAAESIVYSDSLRNSDGKSLVGTLAYISPEQRDGGAPDERADLYACGVVLYEMLTGERPAGTDLPSDLNPAVPKFLDEVFRRTYSRKDKRFTSADEFLKALASGDGAAAKPIPPPIQAPDTQPTAPPQAAEDPPVSPATPPPHPDQDASAPPPGATESTEIPVDPNLIAFDELNKKPITSSDELKAAWRHLYHLRQLSAEEIDSIRKRLTVWANSIPHHKITEFGQHIKITQGVVAPYYWFTLRTEYESREIERREEPYRGKRLPTRVTNEGNIRVWAYPFALNEDFTPANNDYLVEDSQEVLDCQPCRTTGKVDCETCIGKGRVDCPNCDAIGNVTCPRCSGSGMITKYRQEVRFRDRTEYRTVTKYRSVLNPAPGKYNYIQEPYTEEEPHTVQEQYTVDVPYQEPCSGCAGRGAVTCQICNGTREVRCETCVGTGKVTCQNCDGQGKLVTFLLVHDTFEPAEDSRPHRNPALPHDCSSLLDTSIDYRVHLWLSRPRFTPDIVDTLSNASLKSLIIEAIEASKAPCSPGKRIIKQSIDIHRANVAYVKYTYDKKEYDLCLCGSQLQVYAPRSPISKITEDIFVRAVKLLDTEDITAGLNDLWKTFDMHQRDDKANLLLGALRAKLAHAYSECARNVITKGLWSEGLHFLDRATVLFPASPEARSLKQGLRSRLFIVHMLPAALIGGLGLIGGALNTNLSLFIAGLGTFLVAAFAYAKVAFRLAGTAQAFAHSAGVALLTFSTLAMGSYTTLTGILGTVAAIVVVASIYLACFRYLQPLRKLLLRPAPPEPIDDDDPKKVVGQISRLIVDDWGNVAPEYLALSSLWSYSRQMKEANAAEDEAETRREAQADAISDQYKARVSQLGRSVVDGWNTFSQLIHGYLEALNHGNARKVQSLGPEIRQLGKSFCEQIAEFENLCKSPPDRISVRHEDGTTERVQLELKVVQDGSMIAYIQAIKPIAQAAASIQKDPANLLMSLEMNVPTLQRLLAQIQQREQGAATSAAPVMV